jgi:hypothetical protein
MLNEIEVNGMEGMERGAHSCEHDTAEFPLVKSSRQVVERRRDGEPH